MADKKSVTKKTSAKKTKPSINKDKQEFHLKLADKQNNVAEHQLNAAQSYTESVLSAISSLDRNQVELDDVDQAMIAVMQAAYAGQTDKLPLLFAQLQQAQANSNDSNSELEIELFYAVAEGNIEQTKRLIAAGVNVNARDDFGNTPLHIAIEHNFVNTVYWLLKAGADPTIEDELDNTPLQLAQEALARYQEIVKMLTER